MTTLFKKTPVDPRIFLLATLFFLKALADVSNSTDANSTAGTSTGWSSTGESDKSTGMDNKVDTHESIYWIVSIVFLASLFYLVKLYREKVKQNLQNEISEATPLAKVS